MAAFSAKLTYVVAMPSCLIVNRHGLTVLIHAMTGDAIADHVVWLGPSETLDLAALSR